MTAATDSASQKWQIIPFCYVWQITQVSEKSVRIKSKIIPMLQLNDALKSIKISQGMKIHKLTEMSQYFQDVI